MLSKRITRTLVALLALIAASTIAATAPNTPSLAQTPTFEDNPCDNPALSMGIVLTGERNLAKGDFSIITGGEGNLTCASHAVINGGERNLAKGNHTTIGGGQGVLAEGIESTIAGGLRNLTKGPQSAIGGGVQNIARGEGSTVTGGIRNIAEGDTSTVLGGLQNFAKGHGSLAAGTMAYAKNDGSFVWADSSQGEFSTTQDNQVAFRATGGFRVVTANGEGNPTSVFEITAEGGPTWTMPNGDRVSYTDVLQLKNRLAAIEQLLGIVPN